MGWADSIKLSCEKIQNDIDNHCYTVCWKLFNSVISQTPVLKGTLINNWFVDVGGGFSSETTSTQDRSGTASRNRVSALYGQNLFYGKDSIVTLTNNMHYAMNAEKDGWPSPTWSGNVGPYYMRQISIMKLLQGQL